MSEEIKDDTIEDILCDAVDKFDLELCEETLNTDRPSEEEIEADLNAYFLEVKRIQEETDKVNNEAIEYVKTMIDYDFDNVEELLDGNDWWRSMGYVELIKSDYKNCFYPSHDHYKEINPSKGMEHIEYMRQDDSEFNTFHNLVYQRNGGYGAEDSYSGFVLFPLTDGKYWKIKFEC